MKKSTFLLYIFVFILFLLGCSECAPFDRPIGIWFCEELNITLDFTKNPAEGTVVDDNDVVQIICYVDLNGNFSIFFNEDNESEPLYEGRFEYIRGRFEGKKDSGKGMWFFMNEYIDDELHDIREYVFVRITADGELYEYKTFFESFIKPAVFFIEIGIAGIILSIAAVLFVANIIWIPIAALIAFIINHEKKHKKFIEDCYKNIENDED
jgi:hypothetical protein